MGEYNIKTNPDCHLKGSNTTHRKCADVIQDFNPDEYSVVIHSQYNHSSEYNDIALVKLKKPAKIQQNNIKIVCLPFNNSEIAKKMIVIGFGLHENSINDHDTTSVTLKASVDLINNEDCMKQYGNAFDARPLINGQFCAARKNDRDEYVDTCKGNIFKSSLDYRKNNCLSTLFFLR